MQDADLLVDGHLREQQFGAPVGRKRGIRPWTGDGRDRAAASASASPALRGGSGHAAGRLRRTRQSGNEDANCNREK
jgi:hypothetical protein